MLITKYCVDDGEYDDDDDDDDDDDGITYSLSFVLVIVLRCFYRESACLCHSAILFYQFCPPVSNLWDPPF